MGKPAEKRPRHRRKNNTKTDLQELGWGVDWIALAQDKNRWRTLPNAVMKIWVS